MTAAYEYAQYGGQEYPKPRELEQADFIDTYGIQAVYNRPLYVSELYRMTAARNVRNAVQGRNRASDWAQWAKDNPAAVELLSAVEKLRHE